MNWLGDDDLLTEGSLETTGYVLEKNSKVVMAFGSCCSNCSKDNSTFGSVFKSSVQAVIPASKKILKLNNLIFFIFLFLKI
jgi:hypothetical protein